MRSSATTTSCPGSTVIGHASNQQKSAWWPWWRHCQFGVGRHLGVQCFAGVDCDWICVGCSTQQWSEVNTTGLECGGCEPDIELPSAMLTPGTLIAVCHLRRGDVSYLTSDSEELLSRWFRDAVLLYQDSPVDTCSQLSCVVVKAKCG